MSLTKQNKAILILSNVPWDYGWSSRKRITSGLSELNRNIFYSSGPNIHWDLNYSQWEKLPLIHRFKKTEHVFLDKPGKFQVSFPGKPFLNSLILKSYVKSMRKILYKKHNITKLLVICFHPSFQNLIMYLNPDKLIYYVCDDYALSPGWNKTLADLEIKLIKQASSVIGFTSQMLTRLNLQPNIPVDVIPLGVDFDRFTSHSNCETPDDLTHIKGIRACWTGKINHKIDFKLVYNLAKSMKNINWIFIGHSNFRNENITEHKKSAQYYWNKCLKLKNFFYLGLKPHEEIPKYLVHMDLNIMPYDLKSGLWVNNGYPLKMHEYLALGNPVVSSKLESILNFSHVVYFAETKKDWEKQINTALSQNDENQKKKRKHVARQNDWKERISALDKIIINTLNF